MLTKTSRPHRTSPVVRGNWLLQQVMGVTAPPPPPNVPKLNENELKPTSMREMLAQHRSDKACAVCHDRIDPLGFAMENFDPIGRFISMCQVPIYERMGCTELQIRHRCVDAGAQSCGCVTTW